MNNGTADGRRSCRRDKRRRCALELYLVRPDLAYFEQYNEMMAEWRDSGTQIAPWFLDAPLSSLEEFAGLVRMLDDCEHGKTDPRYAATTSWFVADGNGRLVGAASLRHYLTVEGLRTWGHIGYGIRPGERRKGYAVQTLRLALKEAKARNIRRVLIGAHEGNIGSRRTIEKCGGVLENTVRIEGDPEPVCRYWIDIQG